MGTKTCVAWEEPSKPVYFRRDFYWESPCSHETWEFNGDLMWGFNVGIHGNNVGKNGTCSWDLINQSNAGFMIKNHQT